MVTGSIGLGLAWFLAWMFARAALHKLRAPDFYLPLMARYLGTLQPGRPLAWLLAALEGGIALALLLVPTRVFGLAAAAALLLAYAGLMALQLVRGVADMPCGCAGPDSGLGISWLLVGRNIACAALALPVAATSTAAVSASWAHLALAALVALFAVLVYHGSEWVIGNAQWMDGDA